jgi:hypothetical protein
MDKLEQYLDRVCRSIGGPRALRQHVRQELREHLLDAVAQHKAAGLSEQVALDRALEEFGQPDDLRSELEETHGHRMLAVVIDKAMQWKEMTMRAKWLWATWAYLGLAAVVALEVLFITFTVIYIVPRFERLVRDGLVDPAVLEEQGVTWMLSFLHALMVVVGRHTTLLLLLAAVAWGLFEWRVRSENKPLMRLSALGTAAVGLMVVVWLLAGSLLISFCLGAPATGRLARSFAVDQISHLDRSVSALEQALAKKDWEAMREDADQASAAVSQLAQGAMVIPALTTRSEPTAVEELRAQMRAASIHLEEAQEAIRRKDAGELETAMQKFRKAYEPVREAAKRAVR